jgi:hypothetical protein
MIGLPNGPREQLGYTANAPREPYRPRERDEEMQYQAAKLSGHSIKHILDYTEKNHQRMIFPMPVFWSGKDITILRGEGESLTYNGYVPGARRE